MEKLKKNQMSGITLIALVVTIIVLLILAGISIQMLSGDNGILTRAGDAKTMTDEAQIREKIQLAYHSALTGGKGSYTKESLEEELENEFGENNYNVDDSSNENWILTAQGQSITIPAGKTAGQQVSNEEAPTAPTGIRVRSIGGTKATAKATGGTVNSGNVLYKYSIDDGETWSDAIASGQSYTMTNLLKSTEYTIISKTVDSSGNESEAIEAGVKFYTDNTDYDGNIGRYVHYNVNLGIDGNWDEEDDGIDDDWVVFYEDDTNGYTYLIAADYIPNVNSALDAAKTKTGLKAGTGDYATYNVYQGSIGSLRSTVLDELAQRRYKLSWNGKIRTDKLKHKATLALLDTEKWSSFVLKKTENGEEEPYNANITAVGGPTVDLWVASWIQRGYTTLYLAKDDSNEAEADQTSNAYKYGSGYCIGVETNPTSTYVDTSSLTKTGYNSSDASKNNSVYFPHTVQYKYCNGYWLASPSANNPYNVVGVSYTGFVSSGQFHRQDYNGLRPVVALPTSILGADESSGLEIYFVN